MYNLTFDYVHLVPEDNHLHLNTFLSLLFFNDVYTSIIHTDDLYFDNSHIST